MPLRQRFESLLLYDPNRSPDTANVWISHPSPSEEQALGKLVVISTIGGNDRTNLDIINLVQEELRTHYYQTIDSKPERALEHALHETNKRLHQVITDGVTGWLDRTHILVAAIWRDTLVMSSVGGIHAFLLRRSVRDGRLSPTMHDVLEGSKGTVNPVRIFAHTVSGQLQADDQLLFCTPTLLDYFSIEKLRRTMADGRPENAIHHWETTLLGVEQRSCFAAIIVQVQAFEVLSVPASRPVAQGTLVHSAPQVSMDHLIAKEAATARLLSPSVWPAIRDAGQQLWQAAQGLIRRSILRKPPRRAIPNGIQSPIPRLRPSRNTITTLRRGLTSVGSNLGRFVHAFVPKRLSIQQATQDVHLPAQSRRRWRPSINGMVLWFQHLSRRQQGLAALSLVLLFTVAVAILPRSSSSPTTTPTTNQTTIDDELAAARAALLYGGDETAQQRLTAARALLEQLPNRTTKEKTAQQTAQSAIDDVARLLAKQTTITAPTIVAQFAPTAPSANPQQLYLTGSSYTVLDPQQSITITGAIDGSGAPSVIPNTLDTGTATTGIATSTSTIVFATDRSGFLELNTTTKAWKPLDSAWPTSRNRIQALASYQNRIYALDTTNNAIVRFTRSANSLGTGAQWLKEPATLSSARGLMVDGSIFILQPNGIIENYANGRRGTFTLATVEPALTDATRLWTDGVSTKLYVVDPSHERILVYTKTGKLLNQYTSPSWTNIRDIALNEKTKTAYVLSGTTLSSFTLAQ